MARVEKTSNILVYRLASLGDTIVSLPCFHLIRATYPHAKIWLLGTSITQSKASHPSKLLNGTGLVDDYISYPTGLKDARKLWQLRKEIKKINPYVLIYLAATRGQAKIFRDVLFFKSCGIRKLTGVPYTKKLSMPRWLPNRRCYENEAERLARCLQNLGDAHLDAPKSWDLKLSDIERSCAKEALGKTGNAFSPIIACAPGAKIETKHWGKENWGKLIRQLYQVHGNHTLVFVGAPDEYSECEEAGCHWPGRRINLCGKLTIRESAAVLHHADIFIGHDSGPMHLAAAVGTPCVAIFSGRNLPEVWFPYGKQHRIIYHKVGCNGCNLEKCNEHGKKCIMSITVDEVMDAVNDTLINSQQEVYRSGLA